MALNFQKPPAGKKTERPPYGFIEIFWRFEPDDRGNPKMIGLRERWRRGKELANYYVDKLLDRKKVKVEAPHDDYFDNIEDGAFFDRQDDRDQAEREGARGRGENSRFESAGEQEPRVERMTSGSRGMGAARTDRVRVTLNTQDPSRMVGSEQVGPERRIRLNDEPWPLPPPSPEELRAGRDGALDEGARTLGGPNAPLMIEDKSRARGEQEKPSEQPGSPGAKAATGLPGEAAAERGRAAAHTVVERRRAKKMVNRPPRGRAAER